MSRLSNNVKVKPFNMEDFMTMRLLEDERDLALSHAKLLVALAVNVEQRVYSDPIEILCKNENGACGIVFVNDKPLFIGGYVLQNGDCYEIFVFPDKNVFRHPRLFHRLVRSVCQWLLAREHTRTLQTASLVVPRIEKWMKALGFVQSTRSYTKNGRFYRLWSRSK